MDRAGYGDSPAQEVIGWPTDVDNVIELLSEYNGAHLVGQSYGAVVVLLAAGRRPDLVHSLVAIEPPLYSIAADQPAVRAALTSERRLREAADEIRNYSQYDYVLVNREVAASVDTLQSIVRATRSRRDRMEEQIRPILESFENG